MYSVLDTSKRRAHLTQARVLRVPMEKAMPQTSSLRHVYEALCDQINTLKISALEGIKRLGYLRETAAEARD